MSKVYLKKRATLSLMVSLLFLISAVFNIPVNAAETISTSGFSIHYKCGAADPKSQQMRPYLIIYNNSGADVNVSDLKIRYYYTKEGIPKEVLSCFYAAVGASNINTSFYPEKGYAEVSFTSAAGIIAKGANSGAMQLVLKKSSDGYYDQTNDYSFDPNMTDYTECDKITLYYKGDLVWGKEGPVPTKKFTPPPAGDDWLHVDGSQIKNAEGKTVYLTGINWFGYETGGANTLYGLDKCSLEESLDMLSKRGFNLLRIPICAEIIKDWQNGINAKPAVSTNTFENPQLDSYNSLQVLDYTIEYLKHTGMKVMFDMHGASKDGYTDNLWYDKKISMEDFISAWKWLADRYKDDDTVIAVDLKNEPHGKYSGSGVAKWDNSDDPNNWKKAAEDIASEILKINPNLLIVVEGVEAYPKEGYDYSNCGEFTTVCNWWGGNLRGVAKDPIKLSVPNKLIYSAHEYGPDIYMQPWFKKDFDINTLYEDCWKPNWYYIAEQNIAPILIGEWGGKLENETNKKWLNAFADFLAEKKVNHTFWSFNTNSVDTGGLIKADWKTVDEDKYEIIKRTLWMQGLDHKIPLGGKASIKYGDVDGSGTVDLIDCMMLKKYIMNKNTEFPSPDGLEAADVDASGKINSIDYLLVKQYVINKLTKFPAEK